MSNSPANLPHEQQYTALINVRNTELAAYWTRYNIQAVLNLGLTVATLSSKPDSLLGRHMIYTALVGIFLALIWLSFTIWGKLLFTKRWEGHIILYEHAFLPHRYRLFENVRHEEETKRWFRKHWCNLDIPACSIPIILLVIWIIVGMATFIQLKSSPIENVLPDLERNVEKTVTRLEIGTMTVELDRLMVNVSKVQSNLQGINEKGGAHTAVENE